MFPILRLCHMLSDRTARMPEERRHWSFKQVTEACKGTPQKPVRSCSGGGGTSHHVTTHRPDVPCHGTGNAVCPKQTCEHTHTGTSRAKSTTCLPRWGELEWHIEEEQFCHSSTPPSLYTVKVSYDQYEEVTWEQATWKCTLLESFSLTFMLSAPSVRMTCIYRANITA